MLTLELAKTPRRKNQCASTMISAPTIAVEAVHLKDPMLVYRHILNGRPLLRVIDFHNATAFSKIGCPFAIFSAPENKTRGLALKSI